MTIYAEAYARMPNQSDARLCFFADLKKDELAKQMKAEDTDSCRDSLDGIRSCASNCNSSFYTGAQIETETFLSKDL